MTTRQLKIRISAPIQKIAQKSSAVNQQFCFSAKEILANPLALADPFQEDRYTAVKGLVHKYSNRALILLTMNCAAYCRFCTRRGKVSDIATGEITVQNINQMANYIQNHPKISELIFSGGDPLTVPQILKLALTKLASLPQIKVIRVGTRLHFSNPRMINDSVLSALKIIKKQPLYLMLHFEHPDEITKETVKAIQKLQSVGTMLLSQTVFLKGINDSFPVLNALFNKLVEIGIKPYYIFHCDYVKGVEHFIVPIEKEIKIMAELRKSLSGLAYPLHVVDSPQGIGKIPLPSLFWEYHISSFKDFEHNRIPMY
jgi:lysine 2,3-aminomutase